MKTDEFVNPEAILEPSREKAEENRIDRDLKAFMGKAGWQDLDPVSAVREFVRFLKEDHAKDMEAVEKPFYFTFGVADDYPFKGGWVEVWASGKGQAEDLFRYHYSHGDSPTLNCAFVYDQDEWASSGMANGQMGAACHQIIDAYGTHAPINSPSLDEAAKTAKERAARRGACTKRQARHASLER